MKINSTIVNSLVDLVTTTTTSEEVATPTASLKVFYKEELIVSFRGKEFFGLNFEALGKEFTVLPNYDLLVSVAVDSTVSEAYHVEEPLMLQQIEKFLQWRIETLETTTL